LRTAFPAGYSPPPVPMRASTAGSATRHRVWADTVAPPATAASSCRQVLVEHRSVTRHRAARL